VLIHADARAIPLRDESVDCVVTSPPYWGLRDYGVAGQLGLESTPDEYVANMIAVFREVRRVLKADGTLWLNLGDSYATGAGKVGDCPGGGKQGERFKTYGPSRPQVPDGKNPNAMIPTYQPNRMPIAGLKPKDLVGIPWSVAKALQSPFYSGGIPNELDRVWLAATIDAEGSICGFTHERKDDGTTRTGIHLTITNTSRAMLDNAFRIWPTSKQDHNMHGEGHFGSADTYRWIAHNVDAKSDLLREIYPYLIVKRKQALLAWNFLEMSKEAKRLARTTEADSVKERRAWIVDALSRLNHFQDVDVPGWCVSPPTLHEPGWWLRSDVIWHKNNPMPESVTDRPTKAHEYLFLMAKSERYFYDAESIAEKAQDWSVGGPGVGIKATTHYHPDNGGNEGLASLAARYKQDGHGRRHAGFNGRWDEAEAAGKTKPTRNARSVWTIATQPYSGAHFATFPPELVRRCILAGCRPGGIVLDPFVGSGTVVKVARELGRDGIGLDINPAYLRDQAARRIKTDRGFAFGTTPPTPASAV
jgi:DNA modification methylase